MNYRAFIAFLILSVISVRAAETNRPPTWAVPFQPEGLSNFYKLSDRL